MYEPPTLPRTRPLYQKRLSSLMENGQTEERVLRRSHPTRSKEEEMPLPSIRQTPSRGRLTLDDQWLFGLKDSRVDLWQKRVVAGATKGN